MNDLPEPVPCARADCAKSPAAHIGYMLGHLYEESEPDRRQLERASGTPRMVDGPGCTPAALTGRQAATRVLQASGAIESMCGKPTGPYLVCALASGHDGPCPEAPATETTCAHPDTCCASAGACTHECAEVQPAPPAEATACAKCRQPFDPADQRHDGRGRHRDSPFCNSCVSACHDTEIADHWCAVDQWRHEKDYS